MEDSAWHSVYGDATVKQASLDDAGWQEVVKPGVALQGVREPCAHKGL